MHKRLERRDGHGNDLRIAVADAHRRRLDACFVGRSLRIASELLKSVVSIDSVEGQS